MCIHMGTNCAAISTIFRLDFGNCSESVAFAAFHFITRSIAVISLYADKRVLFHENNTYFFHNIYKILML